MKDNNYQYESIILLAFATGMRQGELLGLKWNDIDPDVIHVTRSTTVATHIEKDGSRKRYREVWDTKTVNSIRDIPILPSTRNMLTKHFEQQKAYFALKGKTQPDYLFTTSEGLLIDPSSFHKSYERLLI